MLRDRYGWGKRGGGWRYLRPTELEKLLVEFSEWEWASYGVLGLLGRNERQRERLGHIDSLFLERIAGAEHRYVLAVLARKAAAGENPVEPAPSRG